jgi:hypothetical protein
MQIPPLIPYTWTKSSRILPACTHPLRVIHVRELLQVGQGG